MEKTLVEVFDFGQAINLLKEGKLVARTGWNGKGMFIFMCQEQIISEEFIIGEESYLLPVNFKEWINTHPSDSGKIKFGSFLCMKAADGSIVSGWLASQTDMLAEDWCEVNPYSNNNQ